VATPPPALHPQAAATSGLRNPASWLLNAFGISSTTPSISAEESWRVGHVFACIALRSRVIGSLPCAVYQRQPDGSRVKIGPYFSPGRAISKAPNPFMPPNVFWQGMIANLDVYGNAYAEIQWMEEGDPNSLAVGLWPIPARCMSVTTDADTGQVTYEILPTHKRLPNESVLHLRTFAFDGLRGISRLQAAAKTVGLAFQTEEYGANWFNNSELRRRRSASFCACAGAHAHRHAKATGPERSAW
jgi:HK97 family phage portal protein